MAFTRLCLGLFIAREHLETKTNTHRHKDNATETLTDRHWPKKEQGLRAIAKCEMYKKLKPCPLYGLPQVL